MVKSDDTDVLLLLLYYYWNDEMLKSKEIYMEKGHGTKVLNKKRYIAVHAIANKLGKRICDGLLALHALTGCDTTSSFYKIGKKSAWAIYFRNIDNISLDQFGKVSLSESLEKARQFVSYLYHKENCKNLNEIRLKLTQETKRSAKEIPPTEDAFYLHVQRY